MTEIAEKIVCYHCGDECDDSPIESGGKNFCCEGCLAVFEILQENQLCSYYDLNHNPGIKQRYPALRFQYLEEEAIIQSLINYKNGDEIHIVLRIPAIHCSSCIWLLENFKKLDPGVLSSRVDFVKKEIHLVYDQSKTSLRSLVEKLTETGYEPHLQLDLIDRKKEISANKNRIIRIGVAGFCFGNIMMLSFPEYFSGGENIDQNLKQFFTYLNLIIALPVFFYSASEFYIRSFQALKSKASSIDIPIALGILVLFFRSTYEIISGTGPGYLDSGSGLVFFMLIGRWFQDFTFDSLVFDHDFKSYFPIAVAKIIDGKEQHVIVNDLKENDRILIRNNEIIPVDAILVNGTASIDYQFITGESMPVSPVPGDIVFSGGKQFGSIIELKVLRDISHSRLSQLLSGNVSPNKNSGFEKIVKAISRWFVVVVLFIAVAAAAYWWSTDVSTAIRVFTSVLVIACPCALALSAPFTYGNIVRILGRNKIFLRNSVALERLADIDVVVFDKTGTLTECQNAEVNYSGDELTADEAKMIFSLTRQSLHPLSKLLTDKFGEKEFYPVEDYFEETGRGISGLINGNKIVVGSSAFTGAKHEEEGSTTIFVQVNGQNKGSYTFKNVYRPGIRQMIKSLFDKGVEAAVLTGDNDGEKSNLNKLFSYNVTLRFNQSPSDKLSFIKCLHEKNLSVLMVGDGLNDSGALLQSDVGMSVADSSNSFSPASDAIIDSSQLYKLADTLAYAKSAVRIILISFVISLLYNFVGLSFAVTGNLSPMIAAILMPVSTISLVLFTVLVSSIRGKMLAFK